MTKVYWQIHGRKETAANSPIMPELAAVTDERRR
jgi:hypothetical protein